MWFLCTKLLGFRVSNEAKQMKRDDLVHVEENGEEWVEFNERLTKTRDGINGGIRKFPSKLFPNPDK